MEKDLLTEVIEMLATLANDTSDLILREKAEKLIEKLEDYEK